MSYQATVAVNTAVAQMRELRDDVQRQRAATEKKFADAVKENKEASQKAMAEAKAKREAAESGRPVARPAQEVREEKYTFFDSEDEYNPPAAPSFQMPDVTPPPRPTPRRTARPVYDDDDDYSNQSWME
ncbi:hypothetical protein [Kutzneria sp. 744]|uniref:hypothetical protein n=1 Tax=Kutzneria sp. (strain 744) TaxID=345341 RepID=UPI0003EEC276|nr:hypothetical protein [Kutzneria sp. 744]EWM15598.1 hypothetical protein KUTG_05902 [Kutzneria sp. 744]